MAIERIPHQGEMRSVPVYMERYVQWRLMASGDAETRAELEAIRYDEKEIRKRFGDELRFGTGGLRGIMGAGTARMNIYVVRRATRGLAAYLKKSGFPLVTAIGYDTRIASRRFAYKAADTLVSCGVDVWIYPRPEPAAAVSWAVRRIGCGAGIMITASHNSAEYNGYKVYGWDGCQITDGAAEAILGEIGKFGYFDDTMEEMAESTERDGKNDKKITRKECFGVLREIPEELLDGFLEMELSCLTMSLKDLRVLYTPLNGAGLECVRRSLWKAGVSELFVVPEQERPDGRFPTCPFPNPEDKKAMEVGLRLCEKLRPDIFLATDPDCDRVGAAVPNGEGGYSLLSGNDMGILLFDHICRRRIELRTMPERPVAVTTIVSTEMASAVAAYYGVELQKTLTGFKYIGEQVGILEKNGEQEQFLFGFEESFGYLTHTYVRDKDAVNACLMICEMTADCIRMGRSIMDVLAELKYKYGDYNEQLLTYEFQGADGLEQMGDVMERLRRETPEELIRKRVVEVIDYRNADRTGLPPSNVLEYRLQGGGRITIRPSGTEPKMKIYLSLCQSGDEKKRETVDASDIFRELRIVV